MKIVEALSISRNKDKLFCENKLPISSSFISVKELLTSLHHHQYQEKDLL